MEGGRERKMEGKKGEGATSGAYKELPTTEIMTEADECREKLALAFEGCGAKS